MRNYMIYVSPFMVLTVARFLHSLRQCCHPLPLLKWDSKWEGHQIAHKFSGQQTRSVVIAPEDSTSPLSIAESFLVAQGI